MSKSRPCCSVAADGHCGNIVANALGFEVIYLQSQAATLPTIFGARQYITIDNEGPGLLGVWIDSIPSNSIQLGGGLAGPPVPGSQPNLTPAVPADFTLQPNQSATVAVESVVLVRAAAGTTNGHYVISWCCPTGLNLSIQASDKYCPDWLPITRS